MKLRTKIKLFTSLFMLILIVLVNTSIYFLFYNISAKNELEQLSNQTNAIVEALRANEGIPSNQLLHAFVPTNGIIRVVDKKNNELIPTITKRKEYRNLDVAYSESETHQLIKSNGNNVAVVAKPIIWENGEVVTVQVANYLNALQETMRTLLYVLVAASLIMLVPSIIAGNVLSKFILRPITELIETMKENTKQEKWKTIELENRSHDELYEMEETFNTMIQHLKENFEKQQIFVSDASHELKTPISIIKSYAQLLKRRGKNHPEVFDESVDAIESEADRMQQLVEQMLLLAKNKGHGPFECIDLKKVTEKVIKTFTMAYDRDIYFHSEGEVVVDGNNDQLEQILYILLDNAIKYSEAEIDVKLRRLNDHVNLLVRDKGQGISSTDQKHIFDRFYRVDKARTRTTGGTGLGLSIAQVISELHGGELTVDSEVGKGSTFTLTLPISYRSS